MKRLALEQIIKWNQRTNRKPLIVYGARQVGKTYLIKELFAEQFYHDNYLYIDMFLEESIRDYCLNNIDPQNIISFISVAKNKRINENTLLIFDEVQECPSIISSLKYFNQNFPLQPVIVTGSLVRTKLKRTTNMPGKRNGNFLFPVGKINELTIYPLNYEEFLLNYNEQLYQYLIDKYQQKNKIDDNYHNILMKSVHDYLLIGGMPEVVNEYLTSKSYYDAKQLVENLYNDYLADMDLYQASAESIIRSRIIFKNLYMELSHNSKNFKSGLIEKNSRIRDLKSPIDWLEFSNIIYKSFRLKQYITIPLIPDNESTFRLFMSDMGMFTYQSNASNLDFIDQNKNNTLSGVFYENMVAEELVSNGFNLYYWEGKQGGEFEFILNSNDKIYPLDVKKGKRGLGSLDVFKLNNKYEMAIKVSQNNYGFDKTNRILTIPYYMLFLVLKDIKNNNLLCDCF